MHFEDTMPNTTAGKQRILDEVAHLVIAFSRLKQIDQVALTATATLEESFRRRYGSNNNNPSSPDRSSASTSSYGSHIEHPSGTGSEGMLMSSAAVGRTTN